MRILIYTPSFAPNIGGIETVSEMLAEAFTDAGHEVMVLCQSPHDEIVRPFRVVRSPGFMETLRCWKWAQVVMHMNVSLKGLLPFLLVPRPWVATHHGWYSWPESAPSFNARIKMAAARWLATANIAVSNAVRQYLGFDCEVVPNPHDERHFHLMPGVARDRDLLFVGRLVSDKAPELLLEAMGQLGELGIRPTASFIGSGPEEQVLRDRAKELGLATQVSFTGAKQREELAQVMNKHRVMVVPSRIREGFGIVALEGVACGCVLAVADAGGLAAAAGKCGLLFKRDSTEDLTRVLQILLTDSVTIQKLPSFANEHLARHALPVVASRYIEIFEESSRR